MDNYVDKSLTMVHLDTSSTEIFPSYANLWNDFDRRDRLIIHNLLCLFSSFRGVAHKVESTDYLVGNC